MKLGSARGRKVLTIKTYVLISPKATLIQVGDHYDSGVEIAVLLSEGTMHNTPS